MVNSICVNFRFQISDVVALAKTYNICNLKFYPSTALGTSLKFEIANLRLHYCLEGVL